MSDYTPATWVNGTTGLSAARFNNMESGIDDAQEELQHPVTFVVAANNSSTAEKQAADYLCDGTADQVEINQAIVAANALNGGEIILLGGIYNISDSILFAHNITLQGVGISTNLKIPNSTDANLDVFSSVAGCNNVTIRDLYVDMNKANQASGTMNALNAVGWLRLRVRDVRIANAKGAGIILGAGTATSWIDSCYISGCDGGGIYMNSAGNDVRITSCYVTSCNYGIKANSTKQCVIIGNSLINNTTTGIAADGDDNLVSSNNSSFNQVGIWITGNYDLCIANDVNNNQTIGIVCSSTYSTIIGNQVYANSTLADNTYGNIVLAGSSYCNVQMNTCRKGGNANKPKQGIYIQSDAANNLVTNNDLYDGGSTENLDNDSGTTVTTAGNRTT